MPVGDQREKGDPDIKEKPYDGVNIWRDYTPIVQTDACSKFEKIIPGR